MTAQTAKERLRWMPSQMQMGSLDGFRFGAMPVHRVPFGYECIRFATARGYAVCFRTDTGKAHIAKPMGQQYGPTNGRPEPCQPA